MRYKYRVMILLCIMTLAPLRADEGMWIPLLVEKYQIGDMKEKGFQLNAEDIYSVNQACLKDAVVHFDRGCTGEVISQDGLILTNHHCGLSSIQSHSSVEHDYLSEGFWATNRAEELPTPGLSVNFLRYMEDVSAEVESGIKAGMDPRERKRMRERNMGSLIKEATEGTELLAEVKAFYHGNAYYLFVYESFQDVRLVGAPPSSVGNFGSERDNWVWPRHTGDFSLFRVYADAENHPAPYSPSNRPYKPKKHLKINASGISEGDFTMVMGYPASTHRYLHSEALRFLVEQSYPLRIELRTIRLEIMESHMRQSDRVRIQYAGKSRRVANAWKKWKGVILGIRRNEVVDKKREAEAGFEDWVLEDDRRRMKYEDLMAKFGRLYREKQAYGTAMDLINEGVGAVELLKQEKQMRAMMKKGMPAENIRAAMAAFFKDYYRPIDQEIFVRMMEACHKHLPEAYQPAFFKTIEQRYKGDFSAYAARLYEKSIHVDSLRFDKLVDTYSRDAAKAIEGLEKDPAAEVNAQFSEVFMTQILMEYSALQSKEQALYKRYMAGLMEQADSLLLFPDANRTMRVSYGKVEGYEPADAVIYKAMTTLEGLIQKADTGLEDYAIPEKLRVLYEEKDYGPYGVNGTLPLCFVASNHTSGGNSGSPVLDAHGRLIGLNFDREWEGVMSDFYFDPQLSRNISVDIRYVLFLIDKLAGAGHLLEEMDIDFGHEAEELLETGMHEQTSP